MGGCDFGCTGHGQNVKEAFAAARQEALYESGHGGYTGTIAEKREYRLVDVPTGVDARKFAEWIEDADGGAVDRIPEAHRAAAQRYAKIYGDKYGPALAVELTINTPGTRVYYFFGVASS